MIQQRQVRRRRAPGKPRPHPKRVEVDHRQDGSIVVVEPDQDVAGMKVFVDDGMLMKSSRQEAQFLRERPGDPTAARFVELGEPALDELVERQRIGDRRRDQIILQKQHAPLSLSQGDRRDRRHADRGEMLGATRLVPPFAATEPLSQFRPKIGHQEMLDEHRTRRQVRAIHHPVRTRFDRRQTTLRPPLIQPQTARSQQRFPPTRQDPPTRVSRSRPKPVRRSEQPKPRRSPQESTRRSRPNEHA